MIEPLAAPVDDRIRLTTRFGEFEADPRSLLSFPSGLPGFEQSRRFALLSSIDTAPLQCLHAVSGPPASFLALDPRLVLPDYRCILSPGDAQRLGVVENDPLVWLALLTVNADGVAFANLRAPVVINAGAMLGCQVVPHDSLYPLRHPVVIG